MNTLTILFTAATVHFSLPPDLLSSICFVETRHQVNAIHEDDGGSNSIGVCQVKLATAQWLGYKGDEQGLLDPKTNIYYAAKYLSRNLRRYNGSIDKAVIAYNRGSIGKHVPTQGHFNTAYSRRVINHWYTTTGYIGATTDWH